MSHWRRRKKKAYRKLKLSKKKKKKAPPHANVKAFSDIWVFPPEMYVSIPLLLKPEITPIEDSFR